jgi:hypothetical protein
MFGALSMFWDFCLKNTDCTYQTVQNLIRPLYYGSLALSAFFALFIFLPVHYFQSWLKWLFSWAFPLSVLIVMANVSSGGGPFPIFAREIIIMLSIFFGILTVLFIGIRWYRIQNKQ